MFKKRKDGVAKKFPKKETKKRKTLTCHVGQKCPMCKEPNSVVKRDEGNHISLGDGMAPLLHLRPEAFLPLECKVCNTRFKKTREPFLSRLRRKFV